MFITAPNNQPSLFATAHKEILESLRRLPVAWMLAVLSIKHRYERSLLGPFWITLTQAVYIIVIAFIFGTIFRSEANDFVPFVTCGLLILGWISVSLQESSGILIEKSYKIQEGDRWIFGHVCEVIFRNTLILAHHLIILAIVLIYYQNPISLLDISLALLGSTLIVVNLIGVGMVLALLSLRFRDFGPLVSGILKILFIVTPVMWKPELLGARKHLVDWNPVSHWINLIRDPLVYSSFRIDSLLITLASGVLGVLVAYLIYVYSHRRVSLWL